MLIPNDDWEYFWLYPLPAKSEWKALEVDAEAVLLWKFGGVYVCYLRLKFGGVLY